MNRSFVYNHATCAHRGLWLATLGLSFSLTPSCSSASSGRPSLAGDNSETPNSAAPPGTGAKDATTASNSSDAGSSSDIDSSTANTPQTNDGGAGQPSMPDAADEQPPSSLDAASEKPDVFVPVIEPELCTSDQAYLLTATEFLAPTPEALRAPLLNASANVAGLTLVITSLDRGNSQGAISLSEPFQGKQAFPGGLIPSLSSVLTSEQSVQFETPQPRGWMHLEHQGQKMQLPLVSLEVQAVQPANCTTGMRVDVTARVPGQDAALLDTLLGIDDSDVEEPSAGDTDASAQPPADIPLRVKLTGDRVEFAFEDLR